MSNKEFGCGRYLGRLGGKLSESVFRVSKVENREQLKMADEVLALDGSVLVIGNHPDSLTTAYGYAVVQSLRSRNREATTVMMSAKFFEGDMGWYGDIALQTALAADIEPLKVVQFYDTRPDSEKLEINRYTVGRSLQCLASPGGVVWVYPEGTRSPEAMLEAADTLGRLSERATAVLSLVSPYGSRREFPRTKLKLLPLVNTRPIIHGLSQEIGRSKAAQATADLLMTRIAWELPPIRQGFYRPFVQALETGDPQTERELNLLTAAMIKDTV